jgi:DNA-binding response OmpR family regulator
MSNAASHQGASLEGKVILIVERSWLIATTLAMAFEVKGARVVLSNKAALDLADHINLSAAVLDSHSGELCKELEARGIPYLMYTAQAREKVRDECAAAPIIGKPASAAEVVARVEQLLT